MRTLSSSRISRLVLGSANFGLKYGISNKYRKLEDDELINILSLSEIRGITHIDTAQAYGDSEERLGRLHGHHFDIITKIGADLEKRFCDGRMKRLINESLRRLSIDRLYAVMLHRPEILLAPNGDQIAYSLQELKQEGLIQKVGVSIYAPDILHEISKLLPLDIVQAPFNIFDQRILKSGWSERLKEMGTEIHTRSTFLQGLLLMKQSELPRYFSKNWASIFEAWYNFQKGKDSYADEIALDFALQQPWIDKIVVGVDSAQQLDRLLKIEASERLNSLPYFDVDDIDLIDPSRWRIR